MKYKNTKTGNYVETNGVIYGDLWELVKEQPKKEEPKKEPKKTKTKTK